ncbi:hypothetical protein KO561_14565 [Radiobacillus kanasensis]|uniref:hypothetical protein n=1 Tax=Radiobacillus kanasensis TaxID=2844358 RepID=UPI001E5AEF33|nr:hypothetical protein [Radiobacillus kanasensis]UFT98412.1 hypothetical protein KO561_14565 [Radiobacillus kanasensis]
MGRKVIISLFLLITLILLISAKPLLATLWDEIEPHEVVDQATVVVEGTFDFSADSMADEKTMPYCGKKFNVEKSYKRDVPDQITAGIDCADGSILENFQAEGGRFLLFLKSDPKVGLRVTVGGSNGIVKLKDGNVEEENEERREFFEEYLDDQNDNGDPWSLYLLIILGVLVVWYFISKKIRTRS